MKNNLTTILAILIVVAGIGGFLGGVKYQENKRPEFCHRTKNGGMNRNNNNFRPAVGEIVSADDKSMTIKLTNGGSQIVFISDKTVIAKTETGIKTDLKVGTKVSVFGTENADGTVTAQNIQINPRPSKAP